MMKPYRLEFSEYMGEDGYRKPVVKAVLNIHAIDRDTADRFGAALALQLESDSGGWYCIADEPIKERPVD